MTWTTNTDWVGGEFVLYSTLSSQQNIEMNDVIIENCDDELQSRESPAGQSVATLCLNVCIMT